MINQQAQPDTGIEPQEIPSGGISENIRLGTHIDAGTLDEVGYLLRIHGAGSARIIGGGTEIIRLIRHKYLPALPAIPINLKTIPGLSYIREENGTLKMGALTCLSDIQASELIRTRYSILAETAGVVGSPQVRNMATVAGSICQDVSCWYYRAAGNYYYCLRKGGSDCPARNGDNRWMFSIFGTSGDGECYAACQSDMAITLSALNASVKTTQRTIPIERFFLPAFPGNVLNSDETVVEIQVPSLAIGTKSKYAKFSIRKSIDRPLVSVACVASDQEYRVVVGGVSSTPHHVKEINEMLGGKEPNDGLAEKAGEIAVRNALPMSMNAWKVEVMKTLVKRTILAVT